MSGLNVFVDRKTSYVAVLLILPSVIAVLVLTTLKKNLKKFAILVKMLFCSTGLEGLSSGKFIQIMNIREESLNLLFSLKKVF